MNSQRNGEEVKFGNPQNKPPFRFEYTVPWLDWYAIEKREIKYDDYYYFKLERRFGLTWWLIGIKHYENPYSWEYEEIGQLNCSYLKNFIDWAKTDYGSRITEIVAISGGINLIEDIKELIE